MSDFIDTFFNLQVMLLVLPYLLEGLAITLLLALLLAPLGIALGTLLAIASGARAPLLKRAARLWVNVFRSLPPLVLIILLFSALPFLGVGLPALACVIIALALNSAAFYCEILRAGIGSVPAGQMEAARSTGLSAFNAQRLVVMPQAIRNVLPDLCSNTIELVKATSLASVIAVGELLMTASDARSVTGNISPITLAALLYIALLLPAVRLIGRLERRVGR